MADDTTIDGTGAMASTSAPAATSESETQTVTETATETETDHAVPAVDPEEHDMRDSMRDDADDAEGADMSEMARLLDEQDVQFKSIKRGDVVEGQIVHIDADEILVDIGLKSEGVLSIKELPATGYGSREELNVGDNVLVYVVQPETPEGHAIVSIKRARLERQWRIAQEQSDRGELLEAEVIDFNKGGLIVNLEGIRGFVPISQILNLKREDNADNAETQQKLQAMVGRKLQLKIIEINRNRNRLILSERLAVQEWRARRREELLNELEVGEVRTGTVSNLANFGAFVDLGGADGLVHISQLAWSRVNHPSEVLKVGQKVEVQVLSVDKEKKKIALSIKRAEVDPWTTVESRYTVGQTVTGTITKIAPFGAFARIEDGVEGLIHLSELPSGVSDPKQVLHEGEEVTVRILRIDPERRRLGLSMRQAGDEGAFEEAATAVAANGTATAAGEATDAASARAEATTSTEEAAAATAAPRPRPQPARSEEPPTTAMAAAFAAATRRDQAPEAPSVEQASEAPAAETAEATETAETALPTEAAEAEAEAPAPAEALAEIAHEATAETQTLEPETPTPETPADAVPPDASEVEAAEAGAAKAVEAEAEAESASAEVDSAEAPAEGAVDVGPKAAETATDDTAHTPEGASEE
ncbi:MAG TPA: S1 RNA-binding domain-containing protein [Ktedonobacterales bacterium]|nr:S1 RNA-binding domain-containing protein [Ktedonobacterales bacterium]